jgi:iron complex outermembrane recepter protein
MFKLTPCSAAIALLLAPLATTTQAQQAPAGAQTVERVEVTGSSIRRVQSEGATPLQVITRRELDRAGIVSAEQLIQSLTTNGNGLDNLASNSDVGAGSNRGNNGLSAANLRGQGANATLVLLNGRRMAPHALSGSIVDLNSIPMGAVDRVEVLKDGASAIYGSDAVGGVINFIMRRDYSGVEIGASADITQEGGGNIGRINLIGGTGSLSKDKYNITGTLTIRENTILRGVQRDWVNTFQPDRGLSVDTRGTPFATAVAIGSIRNILSSPATPGGAIVNSRGPTEAGRTTQLGSGINVLDLPGQPGCNSIDGMAPYDELIWDFPNAKFACAWDTGRAAALQQPVKNTSGVLRGVFAVSPNFNLIGEAVFAETTTRKVFSPNQISSSTSTASPFYNLVYPSTGPAYNSVFNAIVAAFPSIENNRGQGITYRWRCMACGPRQIETNSQINRFLVGAEGTFGNWDYKAGYSRAESDVKSTLAGGYYFNDRFAPLLRNATLNPFLRAGETQTQAALDALAAASATGTTLYGGKTTIEQVDASISGSLFKLSGGEAMIAVGVDNRVEKFSFNGNAADVATQRNIFNAPFDSVNTLDGAKREVTAVYGELLMPIIAGLEVTAAVRHDRYNGFGGSTNPKVTVRYSPDKAFLVRGSYNTAFRVPTFAQLYFGQTIEPISGRDLVDPQTCPSLRVSSTDPGCATIQPNTVIGGRPDLSPETAKQFNIGFVVQPTPAISFNVDYWQIRRDDRINILSLTQLTQNYASFQRNFVRDGSGRIVLVDQRWVNTGGQETKGVEFGARINTKVGSGDLAIAMDGTYLISRKSKLLSTDPFGDNEVGNWTLDGDVPVRWKHNLSFNYTQGAWGASLTQSYTAGYVDRVAPGVENGTVTPVNYNPKVKPWVSYDVGVRYTGIKNLEINFNIKNLLNTAPPFSAAYDSDSGAGSSWEPRIADPRGRSFRLAATYRF